MNMRFFIIFLIFVIPCMEASFAQISTSYNLYQCPIEISNDITMFQLPFNDQFINEEIVHDTDSGCLCKVKANSFTNCFGSISLNNSCKIPRNFNLTTSVFVLKNTDLLQLQSNDFQQWGDILVDLILEKNDDLRLIKGGSFSGLRRLKTLRIINSKSLISLDEDSFSGLPQLDTLILEQNGFRNILEVTKAMKHLPHLRALKLNRNAFNVIPEDAFKLENSSLEILSLEQCEIVYLHPMAFNGLRKLNTLNLGDNYFNVSTLNSLLNNLLAKNKLKNLYLFSLSYPPYDVLKIFETLSNSSVEQLNLANNKVDLSHFLLPHDFKLANIRVLNLTYAGTTFIQADAFISFPNLQRLTLRKNYAHISEDLQLTNLICLDLSDVSMSQAKLNLKHVFTSMPRLQYLEASRNSLDSISHVTFQGLISLKSLILRNAGIFYIDDNTFADMQNLLYLDLSENKINISLIRNKDIFKGLKNLEVLLLETCHIRFLTADPLRYLTHLKVLDMRNNRIKHLSGDVFRNLQYLQVIDFQWNIIVSWISPVLNISNLTTVDLRHNKITFMSKAMLMDFNNLTNLELRGNLISCEWNYWQVFQDINISRKLLDNLDGLNCTHPKTKVTYKLLDFIEWAKNTHKLKEENFILTLSISLIVLTILAVAIIGLIYRYRWHLRYALFLTRLYLARHGHLKFKSNCKNSSSNFEYDAFVSYSTEDRNFVYRLVSMLENHEPYLRLCVCERDFQIGSIISESVLESVAKSRRTLLVISDSYAKSQWCRWETQIAENHNLFFGKDYGKYVDDSLIIIKLSTLNRKHLTPTLRYLLKTRIYLEWDADEEKQKVFWKKLRNALAPPNVVDISTNGISVLKSTDLKCRNDFTCSDINTHI